MRWPFGPPHLTLKPSKKTKQKKTKKNKTTTSNHKTQNKTNKTETKATQKKKQAQETQKHLNLPNPDEQQWANPENPPKLGKKKQAFWTLLKQSQTCQKQTFLILTPQKTNPNKKHFAMSKNNPLFFHKFSVFFPTYSFCFWKTVFCWKHYKNSVFRKHSFSKTQLVKPTFSTMSKNTLFQKKVSFFFCNFRWNPYFYSVSCFATVLVQKNFGQNR